MAWVTMMVVTPVMNMGLVGMYELHEGQKSLAKVPQKGTYGRNAYRHHGEHHYEVKECG